MFVNIFLCFLLRLFVCFLPLSRGRNMPLSGAVRGGEKASAGGPKGRLPMDGFCVVFLLRCHNLLGAYDVFIEGFVVLDGFGEWDVDDFVVTQTHHDVSLSFKQ